MIGFTYLVNHDIDQAKIDGIFVWSKTFKFFEQPKETKLVVGHPQSGAQPQSYSAPGREKVFYEHGAAEKSSVTATAIVVFIHSFIRSFVRSFIRSLVEPKQNCRGPSDLLQVLASLGFALVA